MTLVLLSGSAPRAAASLSAMRSAGISVAAVAVPAGEKHADVARAVRDQGLLPVELANVDSYQFLKATQASIVLSIAWPFLFGEQIVSGPWLLLNSHPTLLPGYRGPNPWYHILANGSAEAGVSIHKIDAGMDSGPILHQERVPLTPFDTYRSLRAKVLAVEPAAVIAALKKVASGTAAFSEQDETFATSYPKKRTPLDSEIDPRLPLIDLIDRIRACDPDAFPAFFYLYGQKVCIRLWRPERPPEDHPESL